MSKHPILSFPQQTLIKAASEIKVESLLRLHAKGHLEFTQYLDEFPEEDKSEITMAILDDTLSFERLKTHPEEIFNLPAYDLKVMQFVITNMINHLDYPNAKQALFKKLQNQIDVLNQIKLN